jgi:hypothetical protein
LAAAERVRPQEHRDAAESDHERAELEAADPFVTGDEMRNEQGEEGRRRIEDRREPGRDLRLAPEDQAEGDQIVQQPHDHEGGPGRFAPEEALTGQPEPQIQCKCGKGDATEDDR